MTFLRKEHSSFILTLLLNTNSALILFSQRYKIGKKVVNLEKARHLISQLKVTIEDPRFYAKVFSLVVKERKVAYSKVADNFKRVCAEEYDELSQRVDETKFQESCSVRNVLRTRRLANLLINDEGELIVSLLPKVINELKTHLYSLGPDRQYDSIRQEQILKVLISFSENKDIVRLLKNVSKPYSHKLADQIIRDTLQMPTNAAVTDAHARRAVLAALMCYLRQNVGSCFATAPAIIVHDEQQQQFIADIIELLGTGRLKRTFGGVEYSVPISNTWGAGDLKKPFYLSMGNLIDKNVIWRSPGLINAFEAVGLVNEDVELPEKIGKAKELILAMLKSLNVHQPFIITTAEEIIKRVLLLNYGITEKDLEDFENRPKGMVQGGLLIQMPRSGMSSGGKGQACANFLVNFDVACNALKALADNALLKAWEFTIASFSETKSQFTKWNLYSSLGLGPNEPGGIGNRLYEIIKGKVDEYNRKVQETQYEYEQVFNHLKSLEVRIRHASTEKEAQWIKIEYQTKKNEFYTFEEMRNEINQKAHRFANLFDALMDVYDGLFPQYFQEVYDADMHEVITGPYDDSPAGFRLLYKYGRSNTSQWSRIKNANEFIDCLAAFFINTETEVTSAPGMQGLEKEISEMITAIVNHVRTKEFLETAFSRMAVAHHTAIVKDPLNHLDKIEKKPWAYTSGGTMGTLVSCYYKREQKPTEAARWMESPLELLVFLVDTVKQIPPKLIADYVTEPKKSMLIHSPTHAFLLKPGKSPFKEAWQNDEFTYTWVRDNFIKPRTEFVQKLWLDEESMHFMIQSLLPIVPEDSRHYFSKTFDHFPSTMRSSEFRNYLVETIQKEKGLRYGGRGVITSDEIDSSLYTLLPLTLWSQLRDKIENIYKAIPQISDNEREVFLLGFDQVTPSFAQQQLVSSSTLLDISKALICLVLGETSTEKDYHHLISEAAQDLGYFMPSPILFADTNWVKDEFGFVVNPGTEELELWRLDSTGTVGLPMSAWDQWMNGSRRDISWGVYNRPYEYSL